MDINVLREVVTVLSFGSFVAVVFYAVSPKNRQRFDEAARLPFDEEPALAVRPPPQPSPKGEGANVGHGSANLEHS